MEFRKSDLLWMVSELFTIGYCLPVPSEIVTITPVNIDDYGCFCEYK